MFQFNVYPLYLTGNIDVSTPVHRKPKKNTALHPLKIAKIYVFLLISFTYSSYLRC